MDSPSSHWRSAARGWTVLLALTLSACGVITPAHASCFDVQVPAFRKLRPLVARNASKALAEANARIAALAPNAQQRQPRTLAALHAIQAAAYGELTLTHHQRDAALAGLALLHNPTDPLRLELLTNYGSSFSSAAGISRALKRIRKARTLVPPGSRSDVCLQITEGAMNMLRDRADLAIRELTHAYMQSGALELPDARVDAGSMLTVALRNMGDYKEALAFSRETVKWDKAHHATDNLAGDVYFRGEILRAMGHYHRAISAFKQSRAISTSINDRQAAAYSDLRICEAQIALKRFAAARRECERAAPVLAAGGVTGMVKATHVQLAKIDLAEGHPNRAVEVLNQVLAHRGDDMVAFTVAPAYLARAKANAALGDYANAYRDLHEYLRRYKAQNRTDRTRLKEALEVRFRATQEFERNAVLKRKLRAASDEAAKQKQLLHWMNAAGIAGALAIGLLSYILVADRRHRRQLVVLANQDPLTGLPNRGHTAQLASVALASALERSRLLTVALLDFDHFKAINDQYGHAAGDHVLREFARLSRGALRTSDILGRWGGEEFLLILPDASLDSALATIERLRLLALGIHIPRTDEPMRLSQVTFSAGLATTAEGLRTLDEIVARADTALYEAKDAGRDEVRISRTRSQVPSAPHRA